MSTHEERHYRNCTYKPRVTQLRAEVQQLKQRLAIFPVEEDLSQLDTVLANIAADFEQLLEGECLGCGVSLRSHPTRDVETADTSLAKLQGIIAGLRAKAEG